MKVHHVSRSVVRAVSERPGGRSQTSRTARSTCQSLTHGLGSRSHKCSTSTHSISLSSAKVIGANFAQTIQRSRPQVPQSRASTRVSCTASATAAFDASSNESSKGPFSWWDNITAVVRAAFFYIWTTGIATVVICIMCVIFPYVYMVDRIKRRPMHILNDVWANLTTSVFCNIEVEGKENLPELDEACIFVANHQSYMDIFSLFRLHRPFKFVSKQSIFYIPIIGWSMYLTGHVGLKRVDPRSQMEVVRECRRLIQAGDSVLFFPEGTRSTDGEMAEFKKGAFSIAAKENCPIIPVTIVGTGNVMKNGKEGMVRPGKIKLVVHPRVQGKDAKAIMDQSYKLVRDELHKNDYLVN